MTTVSNDVLKARIMDTLYPNLRSEVSETPQFRRALSSNTANINAAPQAAVVDTMAIAVPPPTSKLVSAQAGPISTPRVGVTPMLHSRNATPRANPYTRQ